MCHVSAHILYLPTFNNKLLYQCATSTRLLAALFVCLSGGYILFLGRFPQTIQINTHLLTAPRLYLEAQYYRDSARLVCELTIHVFNCLRSVHVSTLEYTI